MSEEEYLDADKVWWRDGDNEYADEERALALLLLEGVLFSNDRKYYCPIAKEPQPATTVLFLNTSDILAWACADAEPITPMQAAKLLPEYRKDGYWAIVRFCCKLNNVQPQPPVKRDMIAAGKWDDEMEALPKNWADKS